MITFTELHLKNFGTFKELHLTDLNGMVLLSGDNGTGKSTIPTAISWVLFGQTPKKGRLDDVVNWDEGKGCEVGLVMNIDGRKTTVIRSRKPDNLILSDENDTKIDMMPSEVQETIYKLLDVDFKSFVNATMFSKGVVDYLGEATPAERMKIFKQLLDMELFDQAYDKADGIQKKIREDLIDTQYNVERLEEGIDTNKQTIQNLELEVQQFQKNQQKQIDVIDRDLEALHEKIRFLQTRRPSDVDDIPEKTLQETIKAEREASNKVAALQYNLTNLKRKVTTLPQEGVCDSCFQKIPKDHVDRLTARLTHDLGEYQKSLDDAIKGHNGLQDNLLTLQNQRKSYQEAERISENIAREISFVSQKIDSRIEHKKMLSETKAPSTDEIGRLKGEVQEAKKKIRETSKTLNSLTSEEGVLDHVKTMFSRKGLPLIHTTRYFDYLNHKANEFLSRMPVKNRDNSIYTLKVNLSREKDKIDIDISIRNKENKRYEQASGGERLRIDLALIFALNSLCRNRGKGRIGALIFDEILDLSLDSLGEASLIEILQNLSGEIPFILVISHRESYREYFPIHWEALELGVR